jgi:hypothetical protein
VSHRAWENPAVIVANGGRDKSGVFQMAQSAFKGAISAGVSRPATAAAQASTAGGGSGDVDLKRSVTIYGTVAYPSVAEVSPLDGKYQVAVIADPADPQLKKLEDLVLDQVQAKTGKRVFPPGWHNPVRDGDAKKPNGEPVFKHPAFNGKVVLRPKTSFKPSPVWGSKKVPCDPAEIEGGDQCYVAIGAFAFDISGSKGVGLSLNGLWLADKGTVKIERGGGGASFADVDTAGVRFLDDDQGVETTEA